MSRKKISEKVKTRLWMSSAGRCQFENCNKELWKHDVTFQELNTSYIAHIYAYSPGGPRYDQDFSPKLETDFDNLMLLCDSCHRLIDKKGNETEYSAPRLIQMKKEHEDRVRRVTGILPQNKFHVLMYGANIGNVKSPLMKSEVFETLLSDSKIPEVDEPIELSLSNSSFSDNEDLYWQLEGAHLEKIYKDLVLRRLDHSNVKKIAIFAIAPQPLLIKLGTLLTDISNTEVYQLHREPKTWSWQKDKKSLEFTFTKPKTNSEKPTVILKLEISAKIDNNRIETVFPNEQLSIYSIKVDNPSNDCVKTKEHLSSYRKIIREAFSEIKNIHGENALINIFPAMPISTAIELGRCWMPKADLPMMIYDQNKTHNKFIQGLEIK